MGINTDLDTGELCRSRWDDISVSATQTKVGANLKPDFDYTNIGLLFPQNDVAEKIYITMQMSHKKEIGTSIKFHIHYIQTGANQPTFNATYRFYNNGGTVPVFGSVISTGGIGGSKGIFSYVSGSLS